MVKAIHSQTTQFVRLYCRHETRPRSKKKVLNVPFNAQHFTEKLIMSFLSKWCFTRAIRIELHICANKQGGLKRYL